MSRSSAACGAVVVAGIHQRRRGGPTSSPEPPGGWSSRSTTRRSTSVRRRSPETSSPRRHAPLPRPARLRCHVPPTTSTCRSAGSWPRCCPMNRLCSSGPAASARESPRRSTGRCGSGQVWSPTPWPGCTSVGCCSTRSSPHTPGVASRSAPSLLPACCACRRRPRTHDLTRVSATPRFVGGHGAADRPRRCRQRRAGRQADHRRDRRSRGLLRRRIAIRRWIVGDRLPLNHNERLVDDRAGNRRRVDGAL